MIFDIQTFLLTFVLLMFSMVFDWMFQTNWEATNKFKKWWPRFAHSLEYTIITIAMFQFFQYYTYPQLIRIAVILLVTHFIIDQRGIVLWWMIHVKRIPKDQVLRGPNGEVPPTWWMQIGIDQCMHFVVNFIIAVITVMIP